MRRFALHAALPLSSFLSANSLAKYSGRLCLPKPRAWFRCTCRRFLHFWVARTLAATSPSRIRCTSEQSLSRCESRPKMRNNLGYGWVTAIIISIRVLYPNNINMLPVPIDESVQANRDVLREIGRDVNYEQEIPGLLQLFFELLLRKVK